MADLARGEPVWRDGVHLAGTVLWCDAGRARDLCFFSSGRARPRGLHRKVLATAATMDLLTDADPKTRWEPLVASYGRPFSIGALRLELLPSGHMLGAAALLVTVGERRVLYAGDVNPTGHAALAGACQVRGADTLVVSAPVAALGRLLPPRAAVVDELQTLTRQALDEGRTPVLLATSPGGAQEVLLALADLEVPLAAHPRIARDTLVYQAHHSSVPATVRPARGRPLVWPLELGRSTALDRLGPLRRIAVTGLAIDPDARRRLAVDAALPLSAHADLPGLRDYVRACGATTVYLTAGHCDLVVRALAGVGARALPLGPPRQLALGLG